MTIYTGKSSEKKEDEVFLFPEVVSDALQSHRENQQNDAIAMPPTLVTMSGRRRRGNCYNFCILLIAMSFLVVGVFGGIFLYKHLAHRKFRGWCSVKYYEYQNVESEALPQRNGHVAISTHFATQNTAQVSASEFARGHMDQPGENDRDSHSRGRSHKRHGHRNNRQRKFLGHFEEFVEIDRTNWKYEKIEVPDVEDSRHATVLHDFEMNVTAIVDKEMQRCFIMPLNRANVIPPRDFWDLLNKIGSGYYLPDVELIREEYRIVQPPLQNLRVFGLNVWLDCHRFDTYRLRKSQPGEPVAMVKRSASLGEIKYAIAGAHDLVKVTIKGL